MLNIYSQQTNAKEELNGDLERRLAKQPGMLNRYDDPTGEFDTKELRYSFWYVRHRVLLFRLMIGGLIALAAALWGYSLIRWVVYAVDWPNASRVEQSLFRVPNYSAVAQRLGAAPLGNDSTIILPSGVHKFDAVAVLNNLNKNFLATFDYSFTIGDQHTPVLSTFLLPGEKRPVAYLGIDSAAAPPGAQLMLSNISWKRISPHQIPQPISWQADRLNFTTSNFVYAPAGTDALSNSITFDLTNNTPYSFEEAHFVVGLYDGNALVGISPFTIDAFRSLETRHVDIRNYVNGLQVGSIQVYPIINVYDPAEYLLPPRQ